jgi:hypothetical protein
LDQRKRAYPTYYRAHFDDDNPNRCRDIYDRIDQQNYRAYHKRLDEAQYQIEQIEAKNLGRLNIPDTFDQSLMEEWKHKAAMLGLSSYEIDNLFDWVPLNQRETQSDQEPLVIGTMVSDGDLTRNTDVPDESEETQKRAADFDQWQRFELMLFTATLRKLGRILKKNPMKRPSGKYEQTTKTERTQQDLIK